MLSGAIWMQNFATFAHHILSDFVISAWDRHNIFTTRFSIMIIGIPYTIDYITSTFNWTNECKNSLTKCHMGVNLNVVKPKNPIIHAHATTLLTPQCWNLSIWLNMILPPLKRLTIIIFFLFLVLFAFQSPPLHLLLCNNFKPIFLLLHKPFCLLLTHSFHFVKN